MFWLILHAAVSTQGDNPARPETPASTKVTLEITDTKLYTLVVTLSTEDDKKLLEPLKTAFKRAIKWNIYRSEMTNRVKTNNLTYLIDLPFNKVNLFFVLSFENEEDFFFKSLYTKSWNNKLQCVNRWKNIFWCANKKKKKQRKKILKWAKKPWFITTNQFY